MKLRLGIFDSGIGGFTVLNSLLITRDDVEVIYLADTKRNPYGEKTFDEIIQIAKEISNWFKNKNLDALLIACNTTNACALDFLRINLKIPCFDLINSVSDIVSVNEVGVLATSATIKSSFYKNTIYAKNKNIKVFQQSCPDFVSEIENIPLDFQRLNLLSEIYLKPLIERKVQEIILGCSHYPLIYDILRKKIPSEIKITDPSISLVNNLNKSFKYKKNIFIKNNFYDNVEFFATGEIDQFSLKVTHWLEINKKISFVNLRTTA